MRYQIIYLGQVVMEFSWLLLARRAVREYAALGLAVRLVRQDGKVMQ